MNPMQRPPPPPRSGYSQSLDGVANIVAIVATFFLGPIFFQISIGWVQSFTANQYGTSWVSAASLLWAGVSAAVVYWPVRGTITKRQLLRDKDNFYR